MHTIHLTLSLSLLYIKTLYGPTHGLAAAQDVGSAQLLPDSLLGFGEFEILSSYEEGDEDVVHIRKRATDDECDDEESDCWTYSAWNPNFKLDKCPAEPLNDKRSLDKRGRKPIEPLYVSYTKLARHD